MWAFSLLAIWCLRLARFESCIQQGRKLVSFRFAITSLCQSTIKIKQCICISPELGVNQFRQWSQVGWMLVHHREGLLSSNICLILDSSVGLWVGIQSAGDLVSQTSKVRILHSAVEDNYVCLSVCLYVCNNKYVYRQSPGEPILAMTSSGLNACTS